MVTPLNPDLWILVGGYTAEVDGGADGIHVLRWQGSTATGEANLTAYPSVPLVSPSYLIRHPSRPLIYAVSEAPESEVHTLELTSKGLRLLDSVPTGGVGACHLGFDDTGSWVLVTHYSEGSVTSHRIHSDGTLEPAAAHHHFLGTGADQARQDQSHAHHVSHIAGQVAVCDLGADLIHRLRLDVEGRLGLADDPIRLPAGSGPRHLAVSDEHLIIACELSGDVWLAHRREDDWELVYQASASAADQQVHPSAIRVDGDQVFVANRGPDTFSVFRLDRSAHTLTRRVEVSSGGDWPRDLVLTDDAVWIANQSSDAVSVFRRVPAKEASTDEWVLDVQLPVPSPACIVLVPGQS